MRDWSPQPPPLKDLKQLDAKMAKLLKVMGGGLAWAQVLGPRVRPLIPLLFWGTHSRPYVSFVGV